MMSLKFLILEDSILDAELITALLAESEIECESIQVKTRSEFQAALERGGFDLILSDYSLPGFDGISALVMARQLCPDVPFIFVTATMGEEVAIETLKGGATDYVLKQRLERLIPAVERSLREAAERRARVVAEAELNRREEEFRALVENSPDIIARFDRDLRHLYVNPVVEQATGLPPETYVGKTHAEVGVSVEICTLWQSSLRQVFATQQADFFEYDFPAPGNGIRYYQTRVVPEFNPDGSVQTLLAITRDITQSKLAEQALRAREAQLRQQAEELKRANQVKDEFLAVLSHELRSPLNAILGWAKLLRTRKFSSEIFNRALETIERNAQLQTRLIEDLLDISRIIRGKLTLNPQPVNLETVITSVLETVCLSAQTKCIELVFEGAGSASVQGVWSREERQGGQGGQGSNSNHEPPATSHSQLPTTNYQLPIVLGDSSRLQQIVWNLLSNAIKFTPSGGRVTVELQLSNREQGAGSREQGAKGQRGRGVEETRSNNCQLSSRSVAPAFTVNCQPTTNYAQIVVTDTGIGISAEFLPHIFDYFRQADASITRSYGGLGLGLAIVRHLVELHGGTVCAESLGVGQGATFRVMLPLLETAEFGIRNTPTLKQATEFGIHNTQLPCTGAQPCAPTDSQLNNIRVLVVEDDRDMREFLALTLEEYGAQLIVVDSAVAALEALEKSLPDILVSDIGMPATDGYTFIQKVRALPPEQGGKIPAIALTAYAREQDRDRAIAAGFQIHLAKPVVPDELVEAIGQLISA
ncbi:MAG: Sensor histidine kinase TodS [Chroococcidiopsis sp. SAG 2025]|uniref:hybrid sensor histidine kinase/response regulator n=1 Tax=Chroococcidiopsis sp. SAG 2025 TaxID=171389 RepID=UPI002937401C|nr:response regulator [Chroococcidiopsis sp. SAG 2025]MDV2995976.1 Sensor histidine kinase TodS [Chroococcidiopsis sp. SAG 2025]